MGLGKIINSLVSNTNRVRICLDYGGRDITRIFHELSLLEAFPYPVDAASLPDYMLLNQIKVGLGFFCGVFGLIWRIFRLNLTDFQGFIKFSILVYIGQVGKNNKWKSVGKERERKW